MPKKSRWRLLCRQNSQRHFPGKQYRDEWRFVLVSIDKSDSLFKKNMLRRLHCTRVDLSCTERNCIQKVTARTLTSNGKGTALYCPVHH